MGHRRISLVGGWTSGTPPPTHRSGRQAAEQHRRPRENTRPPSEQLTERSTKWTTQWFTECSSKRAPKIALPPPPTHTHTRTHTAPAPRTLSGLLCVLSLFLSARFSFLLMDAANWQHIMASWGWVGCHVAIKHQGWFGPSTAGRPKTTLMKIGLGCAQLSAHRLLGVTRRRAVALLVIRADYDSGRS